MCVKREGGGCKERRGVRVKGEEVGGGGGEEGGDEKERGGGRTHLLLA